MSRAIIELDALLNRSKAPGKVIRMSRDFPDAIDGLEGYYLVPYNSAGQQIYAERRYLGFSQEEARFAIEAMPDRPDYVPPLVGRQIIPAPVQMPEPDSTPPENLTGLKLLKWQAANDKKARKQKEHLENIKRHQEEKQRQKEKKRQEDLAQANMQVQYLTQRG